MIAGDDDVSDYVQYWTFREPKVFANATRYCFQPNTVQTLVHIAAKTTTDLDTIAKAMAKVGVIHRPVMFVSTAILPFLPKAFGVRSFAPTSFYLLRISLRNLINGRAETKV